MELACLVLLSLVPACQEVLLAAAAVGCLLLVVGAVVPLVVGAVVPEPPPGPVSQCP